jgi:hypothetical protein
MFKHSQVLTEQLAMASETLSRIRAAQAPLQREAVWVG